MKTYIIYIVILCLPMLSYSQSSDVKDAYDTVKVEVKRDSSMNLLLESKHIYSNPIQVSGEIFYSKYCVEQKLYNTKSGQLLDVGYLLSKSKGTSVAKVKRMKLISIKEDDSGYVIKEQVLLRKFRVREYDNDGQLIDGVVLQ